MYNFKYTRNWFINSELSTVLLDFVNPYRINHILEIGCYEGLSSASFATSLLTHADSRLTCVDPFLTISNNDYKELLLNGEEQNFNYNTAICKNSDKIFVHKVTSDRFFRTNKSTYNFIYIDGCHLPEFIARDMENAFKVLEEGGIMWMNDYTDEGAVAMDAFLDKHAGQYKIVHKGYQLGIQSTKSIIVPFRRSKQ